MQMSRAVMEFNDMQIFGKRQWMPLKFNSRKVGGEERLHLLLGGPRMRKNMESIVEMNNLFKFYVITVPSISRIFIHFRANIRSSLSLKRD